MDDILPKTIDAIEIMEPGDPGVLKPTQRACPTPGRDEVLIKVAAAGVNRPDVLQRTGNYAPPQGTSDIPGLEVSGTIVATGPNTGRYRLGENVCALVAGGGYATYVAAPVQQCLPIPHGLSMVEAAALPETFFTVWVNVFQRGRLHAGESILIHGGTSGIGTTAIQLAKAFGATVYTTAGGPDKVAACLSLGADVAVDYRSEDFVAVVKDKTGGRGVDLVLDMVGGDYVPRNIACLAPLGRHVSIAFLRGAEVGISLAPIMLKRLTLTGSTLRPRTVAEKGAIAAELESRVWPLLAAGTVKPQIYKTFPLTDAAEAHRLMETSTHVGKIMLIAQP